MSLELPSRPRSESVDRRGLHGRTRSNSKRLLEGPDDDAFDCNSQNGEPTVNNAKRRKRTDSLGRTRSESTSSVASTMSMSEDSLLRRSTRIRLQSQSQLSDFDQSTLSLSIITPSTNAAGEDERSTLEWLESGRILELAKQRNTLSTPMEM